MKTFFITIFGHFKNKSPEEGLREDPQDPYEQHLDQSPRVSFYKKLLGSIPPRRIFSGNHFLSQKDFENHQIELDFISPDDARTLHLGLFPKRPDILLLEKSYFDDSDLSFGIKKAHASFSPNSHRADCPHPKCL